MAEMATCPSGSIVSLCMVIEILAGYNSLYWFPFPSMPCREVWPWD